MVENKSAAAAAAVAAAAAAAAAPDPDRAHPSGLPPELLAAPPWILGHRGAPLEAPENTLASLRRALELGLDGVEYDLQPSAEGEPVLMHDEDLARTTGVEGPVARASLRELARLEAGGWFAKRFAGEPVPLFADALALAARFPGAVQMVELKAEELVERVVERLAEALHKNVRPGAVRIASFHRGVCLAARDLGHAAMLLAVRASETDRAWIASEGIAAYGVGPGGFDGAAPPEAWSAERWGWSVDRPEHLLAAVREPLFGFNTNEPRRALGARALLRLAPADLGPWPLAAPLLEVVPGSALDTRGPFGGAWRTRVGVRNPFATAIGVELELEVRRGAFEVEGLPAALSLGPGEAVEVNLELVGGSWSPGPDPLLVGRFLLPAAPGRGAVALTLDAPLERVRVARLRGSATRLEMLRESPAAPPASAVIRRRGGELLYSVEGTGGLEEVRAVVILDGRRVVGTSGLRCALPEDFAERPGGVGFACGFTGRDPADGRPVLRRWSGGLPPDPSGGSPGRLLPG